MSTAQDILGLLLKDETLSQDMAEKVFGSIMKGEWLDSQIAALLTLMAKRGETVEEITGAAKALRAKASTIQAPKGAVDCCGTGGDGASTLNISSAVAFVLAAGGIPVAKHGNRAASSKSGAADVLEGMGIPLTSDHTLLQHALNSTNYCFLMAPNHHKAVKHVASIRKELGYRTIFNLLGPLANPANVAHQLIGVYDPKWLRPMAEVLKALGSKNAWIVHGRDGLDEITVTEKTDCVRLDETGKISDMTIDPQDYNFPKWTLDNLKGGDAAFNANALKELMHGKYQTIGENAYFDIVCLNAGAVFTMMGQTKDINEGIKKAAHIIKDGTAVEKIEEYKNLLKQAG